MQYGLSNGEVVYLVITSGQDEPALSLRVGTSTKHAGFAATENGRPAALPTTAENAVEVEAGKVIRRGKAVKTEAELRNALQGSRAATWENLTVPVQAGKRSG